MHVVITRPVQDAEPLKSRIEDLGCEVTLAPLIETLSNDISEDVFNEATAIVVTSQNALAALEASRAKATAIKLPIYVVGPGTAQRARDMGFDTIFEGRGRAEGLVPVLAAAAGALAGRLIYLRGDVLAFDLEAALGEKGVNLVPVPAYQAQEAAGLPGNVIKALQTGSIDAVTLMSPRTARIWTRLVAGLSPPVQLSDIAYLCLSERVGEALGALAKPENVLIASQPNLEEMLALIKRLAASSKAG